jgi:mannose-6-phosphate isomerase
MKHIRRLKNPIQEYAWGSYTAIAELLGTPSPSSQPQAELWMGAHPKAPSMVYHQGRWQSLFEVVANAPETVLGAHVAERFGSQLPFLFKVLAAAQPLSIQAHPSQAKAAEGFARENRQHIPLDASERNYKDANHKPECICALTPFWSLNGFRPIPEILALMEPVCADNFEAGLEPLWQDEGSQALQRFLRALLMLPEAQKRLLIDDAVRHAEPLRRQDTAFEWLVKLHAAYPNDVGILAPLFLNLICLAPGEAMFLPSGALHAYLDGVGIELMANSDNVLRGGLTPKHVDVVELLSVLNFEVHAVERLHPQAYLPCEQIYPTQAEEFNLSVIQVGKHHAYQSEPKRGVEILLCVAGNTTIEDRGSGRTIDLPQGASVIVPAAADRYTLAGVGKVFKAATPFS